jgi:hypothetical protein
MSWESSSKKKKPGIQPENYFESRKYSFVIDRDFTLRTCPIGFQLSLFRLKGIGIACFSAGDELLP